MTPVTFVEFRFNIVTALAFIPIKLKLGCYEFLPKALTSVKESTNGIRYLWDIFVDSIKEVLFQFHSFHINLTLFLKTTLSHGTQERSTRKLSQFASVGAWTGRETEIKKSKYIAL